MARTLIIDDENHCADRIAWLLSRCAPEFEIADKASSVEEAIASTHKHHPDLVFLDVQIGNKTGFDYLRQVEKTDFDVIFTTAYDQYAIEAFKFSALDYLLKPIGVDDFTQAIKRYTNRLSRNHFDKKMDVLLHNLKSVKSKRKITLPTQEGYEFLDLGQIIRFQADGNYTHIYLVDRTKFTVSKTLKTFDEIMEGSHFFRVHHSHLINIEHVKKYTRGKGGYVTMIDDSTVDVSTRKRDEFLSYLIK